MVLDKRLRELFIRSLNHHRAILVVGSGISCEAKNRAGINLPLPSDLTKLLADAMRVSDSGVNLGDMFELFLKSSKLRLSDKTDLLNRYLLATDVPEYLIHTLTLPWRRIYSFNIDNVLDLTAKLNDRKLDVIRYPVDTFFETDETLEKRQIVHLHGKLPCSPEELIFSRSQYAVEFNRTNPLYMRFVEDYSTCFTVFVGTSISEPLFDKYVSSRGSTREGERERRLRSVIFTQHLPPAKAELYRESFNLEYIESSTQDFSHLCQELSTEILDDETIVKNKYPSIYYFHDRYSGRSTSFLSVITRHFRTVPSSSSPRSGRSSFLLGRFPEWTDILDNKDVIRDCYQAVCDAIEIRGLTNGEHTLFVIDGEAGSGKSTLLKRVAMYFHMQSRTLFFSHCDSLPTTSEFETILDEINDTALFFFDNTEHVTNEISALCSMSRQKGYKHIFVIAIRSSSLNRLRNHLDPEVNELVVPVNSLSIREATDIVAALDKEGLLGHLRTVSPTSRPHELANSSKRQLLVALKEVTSGRRFDDIIEDEFSAISSEMAKDILTTVAIVSRHGLTLSRQTIVGCFPDNPNSVLHILDHDLRGILYSVGDLNEDYLVRHRVVAEHIIEHCIGGNKIRHLLIHLLQNVAPQINERHSSRNLRLFRELINHSAISRNWGWELDECREVYNSLQDFYGENFNFWLQRGSLETEMETGDPDLGINYLKQAEALFMKSSFVKNALANAHYRKAVEDKSYVSAQSNFRAADDYIAQAIYFSTTPDPYSSVIRIKGQLNYYLRWFGNDRQTLKIHLARLIEECSNALASHPRNQFLESTLERLKRNHLSLAVENARIEPTHISWSNSDL